MPLEPKDRPEMLGGIGVEKYGATVRDRGIGEQRRTGRPMNCRAQEPRIGPVTRSFSEFARPAPSRRPRRAIQNVQGRDTCFVNIVSNTEPHGPLSRASLDEETRW